MAMPEKRFKCGACEAAIFENEITTKDGRNIRIKKVSFQKRYKGRNGEWASTNSLDANDIPKAQLVLSEAYKYLVLGNNTKESENSVETN